VLSRLKPIAGLLALALVFGLAGCPGHETKPPAKSNYDLPKEPEAAGGAGGQTGIQKTNTKAKAVD